MFDTLPTVVDNQELTHAGINATIGVSAVHALGGYGIIGHMWGQYERAFPLLSDTAGGSTSAAPRWGTWYFTQGVVGVGYDQAWDLDGTSPTTYSLASGSLPPGLALGSVSGNEGRIFGVPTTAGSYTFTLTAANASGTASHTFTITVVAASGGGSSYTFAT